MVRVRTQHTGEPYQTALQEARAHGPLPRAQGAVAVVEFLLLSHLARGPLAAKTTWPEDTVLGIRSVTPRPNTLIVDVAPEVLGPMLETVLPRAVHDEHAQLFVAGLEPARPPLESSGDYEPRRGHGLVRRTFRSVLGAAGVRARLGRRGLELWCGTVASAEVSALREVQGGLADGIVLRGVTEADWIRAQQEILAGYRPNEVPLWRDVPHDWAPEEFPRQQDVLHDCRNSIEHGSALLRRIGLLRDSSVRCLEPDFAFCTEGRVLDHPAGPRRRRGAMAVQVTPPSPRGEVGDLVWVEAAQGPLDQRHWVIGWGGRTGTAAAPDRAPLQYLGVADAAAAITASTTEPRPSAEPRPVVDRASPVNEPVAVMIDGILHVAVFPDHFTCGQCTAMTKRRRRCRNEVWEEGQVAGWVDFAIGGVRGSAYGPLKGAVAQRYLTQRCRLHADAQPFCQPEWELFTPVKHSVLLP